MANTAHTQATQTVPRQLSKIFAHRERVTGWPTWCSETPIAGRRKQSRTIHDSTVQMLITEIPTGTGPRIWNSVCVQQLPPWHLASLFMPPCFEKNTMRRKHQRKMPPGLQLMDG
jgi:hypothetical protein